MSCRTGRVPVSDSLPHRAGVPSGPAGKRHASAYVTRAGDTSVHPTFARPKPNTSRNHAAPQDRPATPQDHRYRAGVPDVPVGERYASAYVTRAGDTSVHPTFARPKPNTSRNHVTPHRPATPQSRLYRAGVPDVPVRERHSRVRGKGSLRGHTALSRVLPLIVAALALSACSRRQERAPVIGDAFVGPANLDLRKDIDPKSSSVTVVHHGDHVEIIGQRRLWYKVRTSTGVEGWTDDRQLLDSAEMARLRKLAEQTSGLPSQGKATTYDVLNVHTEPIRTSPSFVQVKEKETFDVIAHRIIPRTAKLPKRQLIRPVPKPPALPKKPGKKKGTAGAPPPPPVPVAAPPPAPEVEAGPVPQDDWTLIRTAGGQSGWVLTSRVYMSIPDDVARYAEGHRITSYFSIGTISDHGEVKDTWLWTTAESLGQDYDFDGYRVFIWSPRGRHYETAFIQKRERGYLPVIAKTGEFSVCVEDKAGARVRKLYHLEGNRVRPAGMTPCEVRAETDLPAAENKPLQLHAPVEEKKSWAADWLTKVKKRFGKGTTR